MHSNAKLFSKACSMLNTQYSIHSNVKHSSQLKSHMHSIHNTFKCQALQQSIHHNSSQHMHSCNHAQRMITQVHAVTVGCSTTPLLICDCPCRPSLLLLLLLVHFPMRRVPRCTPGTWLPGWRRYCSAAVALPLPAEVSVCPAMSLRCPWGHIARCAAAVPAGIPVS